MIEIIITYDVVSDRRRVKLCKILKDYGEHIQYSVFHILISNDELEKLKKKIARIIDKEEDSVKIFFLSKSIIPNQIELGAERTINYNGLILFD